MHERRMTDFCRDDTRWGYFVAAPYPIADGFARIFRLEQPVGDELTIVRVIQGRRCETPQSLFQEWAAALQFPYYFGHNWDAFDECITDLEWLPGSCYTFFVTQLDLVLPQYPNDFKAFIEIMHDAHDEWKTPNRYHMNEPTANFTVVFHAEADKSDEALARLRAAGADPVEARFSDEFMRLTADRP